MNFKFFTLIFSLFALSNPLFAEKPRIGVSVALKETPNGIQIIVGNGATINGSVLQAGRDIIYAPKFYKYYTQVPAKSLSDREVQRLWNDVLLPLLQVELNNRDQSLLAQLLDLKSRLDTMSLDYKQREARIMNHLGGVMETVKRSIVKVDAQVSNLIDYDVDTDELTPFPFTDDGFAKVEYKGGTRSVLIRADDFSFIQHCYLNGKRLQFINTKGFHEHFGVVQVEGKGYAYINTSLRVVSDWFEDANLLRDGVGLVEKSGRRGKRFGYVEVSKRKDSQITLREKGICYYDAHDYSQGIASVKKDSRDLNWFIIDLDGHTICRVDFPGEFKLNRAIVGERKGFLKKKIRYGVIDRYGKYIIKPVYKSIQFGERYFLMEDEDYFVFANISNGQILKNKQGKTLKFAEAQPFENAQSFTCVRFYGDKSANFYLINGEGQSFSMAIKACEGPHIITENGEGLIAPNGNFFLIPPVHLELGPIVNGCIRGRTIGGATVYYRKESPTHFVKIGSDKSFGGMCYVDGADFSEGLAAVRVLLDGKYSWGFIDKFGNFKIAPQYEMLLGFGFKGGYALMQKESGEKVYVDHLGREKELGKGRRH